MKKERDEYKYIVYFYSEPNFMVLENESIIDISLHEDLKRVDINYSDYFFDFNLKNCKDSEFTVVTQCYNRVGQFLEQLEISGDTISFDNNILTINYEQLTSNKAWASINQLWEKASDVYNRERISYYRQSKIERILK